MGGEEIGASPATCGEVVYADPPEDGTFCENAVAAITSIAAIAVIEKHVPGFATINATLSIS
jgi:hypothetical protein